MENTRNPEATQSSISQTEAYFNSLLKSQTQETNSDSRRKFKPFTLLILIAVIFIPIYFAVNYYIKATNIEATPVDVTQPENSGAYFDPGYYTRERTITGKISKGMNTVDEERSFELLDNDGKNIAYIYSKDQDLNLSIGLTVEIRGQLSDSAEDGKEIIEVKSIRLK